MARPSQQDGVDIGSKLLYQTTVDAYDLRIESYNNQLECRASIEVFDIENSIAPVDLVNLLNKLEITDTIDLEQLAVFCTMAAQDENPQTFLLAEGIAPTPGVDGWFELGVKTSKEKTVFEEDDQGKVDYKAVQGFSNIEVGQVVGIICPPQMGRAGRTITGLPIAPLDGRPATLFAGEGIKISADGTQIFAEKAGRVVLEDHRLYMAEEFVVSGDIDLKVGNIDFNGFVEVKGDVLDDFNIRAGKGLLVTGSVGACHVEVDGPVTIGSMNGLGTGLIRCSGDLEARYLNHANIECMGDIKISHEIRSSVVKSTGLISVEQGNIIGGKTVALEGIEAKTFGSDAGVKTYLTSGIYFPETDRLQYLRSHLKSVTTQLKRLDETLRSLNKKPLANMRHALREAIELRIGILTQRQVNLVTEREEMTEELNGFQLQEHKTANPKINASRILKEGVTITLGETTHEFKLEHDGPVSIIENSELEVLRYLTMSPLKVSAVALEEELQEGEKPKEPQTPETKPADTSSEQTQQQPLEGGGGWPK